MPTQDEINRLRFGMGRPGFPKPYRGNGAPIAGGLVGGYTGPIQKGVMATPPPRPPVPYTPPTMFTEGGGGVQTPDIGHFLNPGGMGLPNVKDVRATRQTARSARKTARKELRQARRSVAPAGTTKAANIAAKKSVFKTARKEARATRGTVRKAKRTFRKRAGT